MGSILLPRQEATTVTRIGQHIEIVQFDGDDCETEIGRVVLTVDQFREIYNHEKHILTTNVEPE